MKIRPATAADAQAICDLWNPVIRDTLFTFTTEQKSPAAIRTLIADRAAASRAVLVATRGATLLGFATYGPFRAGPGYARTAEHTIILGPDARGRGTGRALLAAIEDHARARGIHTLIAGVSGANPGAVAFHRACGYEPAATLPQVGYKAGRYLDLVLLRKLL